MEYEWKFLEDQILYKFGTATAVLERTETTTDTSGSADELYTVVEEV